MNNGPFKEVIAKCDTTVIEYDGSKYNALENLKLHVHKVKGVEDKNRKTLLFIHGGGAWKCTPEDHYFLCC